MDINTGGGSTDPERAEELDCTPSDQVDVFPPYSDHPVTCNTTEEQDKTLSSSRRETLRAGSRLHRTPPALHDAVFTGREVVLVAAAAAVGEAVAPSGPGVEGVPPLCPVTGSRLHREGAELCRRQLCTRGGK